jgi:hypothetical protein
MPLISNVHNGEIMKRDSYKKGPRFGPGACEYLEDVIQQPVVVPVEHVVVVEPVEAVQVVTIAPAAVEQETVIEPVVEAQPVVKPVATTGDSKSLDKKKK